MPSGYLALVLHAHLPFIRHPEEPVFLEESWLFEAITETYIPLLERLERLHQQGVPTQLTMTWSPPLCEMLCDPLLQQRYRHHTSRLLELAEQEVGAKANTPFAEAAVMYRDHFRFCLACMDRWNNNLLLWVRELMDKEVIEPITCGATHGFLPLMKTKQAQRAQIAVAAANYRKHFGRSPRGIWLPECGYTPGIEELLKEQGIRFFFVDTHGILYANPRPRYAVYAPVYTPAGVAAMGRDPESSRQVWSSQTGYPGDPCYREFYRDLGYDGDYDYVRNFLHPDGIRRNLGLKYHKVTGKVQLHEKQPYSPSIAFAKAMEHGAHFADCRKHQCNHLHGLMGKPPLIVSPYDAELFGHWWFEGTQFVESIFHSCAADPDGVQPIAISKYLEENPAHQVSTPNASSWGAEGSNKVWLNATNDYMYRHLHVAEERMRTVARMFHRADALTTRFANQMARELLLAQSSDWAFILTHDTTTEYATRRFKDHINRFTGMFEQLMHGVPQHQVIDDIEWRDTIFQEIDYRVYA